MIEKMNFIKFIAYILGFVLLAWAICANAHTFDVHCDPAGDHIRDKEIEHKKNEEAYKKVEEGSTNPRDLENAAEFANTDFS